MCDTEGEEILTQQECTQQIIRQYKNNAKQGIGNANAYQKLFGIELKPMITQYPIAVLMGNEDANNQ